MSTKTRVQQFSHIMISPVLVPSLATFRGNSLNSMGLISLISYHMLHMLKLFNCLPQPSLQCKATKEGDVEDSVEMPVTTECPSFDGFWDARPEERPWLNWSLYGSVVFHNCFFFGGYLRLPSWSCLHVKVGRQLFP